MLHEFFGAQSRSTRAFAWIGTIVLAAHGVYSALLSRRLVDWQGRFYDRVGDAAKTLAIANETAAMATGHLHDRLDEEAAVDAAIEAGGREVSALLGQFALLVMPMALVHPVNRFIRRRYTFAWRMALTREYTDRWSKLHCVQLEGISQRIQEDTQRFGRGLETCASDILDAILTLVVFAPTLVELGEQVPVGSGAAAWLFRPFGAWWLIALALAMALLGWTISLFVAQRLVTLEVRNQIVEAEFRKRLVLTEVGGVVHADGVAPIAPIEPTAPSVVSELACPENGNSTTPAVFSEAFVALRVNYLSLYRHFFAFDAWISLFDQAMVILPYAIVAPMLFRREAPVSLGTLVKTSSVFGRVFGALSLPAFNWASVNDFRSVIRRLGAMERALGIKRASAGASTRSSSSSPSGVPRTTTTMRAKQKWAMLFKRARQSARHRRMSEISIGPV